MIDQPAVEREVLLRSRNQRATSVRKLIEAEARAAAQERAAAEWVQRVAGMPERQRPPGGLTAAERSLYRRRADHLQLVVIRQAALLRIAERDRRTYAQQPTRTRRPRGLVASYAVLDEARMEC